MRLCEPMGGKLFCWGCIFCHSSLFSPGKKKISSVWDQKKTKEQSYFSQLINSDIKINPVYGMNPEPKLHGKNTDCLDGSKEMKSEREIRKYSSFVIDGTWTSKLFNFIKAIWSLESSVSNVWTLLISKPLGKHLASRPDSYGIISIVQKSCSF